jgi:hypothetical protein
LAAAIERTRFGPLPLLDSTSRARLGLAGFQQRYIVEGGSTTREPAIPITPQHSKGKQGRWLQM